MADEHTSRDPVEHPPVLDAETRRVQRLYEAMAPNYDRIIAVAERLLFADGRAWACAQARGQVLEVGIGTGRNLPFYPEGTALTGLELSPAMLTHTRRRAAELDRHIELRVGDAQQLPFGEASFDTVIATLTQCSVPDDAVAVAEMARVLRPGGRLVLLDHVASPRRGVRAAQAVLDPLFVRLQGDHLLRDPQHTVLAAGLDIDLLTRSRAGIVLRLTATKPDRAPEPERPSQSE